MYAFGGARHFAMPPFLSNTVIQILAPTKYHTHIDTWHTHTPSPKHSQPDINHGFNSLANMTFSLSSSLTYIPFNVSAFIPAPSPKFNRDPSTMSKHRTGFGRVGTVNSAKIEEINIDDFDSIDVSSYCQEDKEGGPPIYNDSTWMLGDFEVITADNVRFRVPSYYLFASR